MLAIDFGLLALAAAEDCGNGRFATMIDAVLIAA